MASYKRTLIIVSSLAAIPLTTLLVAGTLQRRRRKSSRRAKFLRQTKSTKDVNTNTATDKQQVRAAWQGSETRPVTDTANTTTTSTITSNSNNASTIPAPLTSPILHSRTDSDVIIPHQTVKETEPSLSDEAKKAGGSLKELIVTAVKEAKDSATQTGRRMKEQTINIAATVDSKDIQSLEANADALVDLFEETMAEIRKEGYDDQIKLLDSYKELLLTHIKVVHARARMASKLKPGA